MQKILLFFLILVCTPRLYPKLKDFQEDTVAEEKKKSPSENSPESSLASAFFGAFVGIFATFWYDWNNAAHYDQYPYARNRAMIEHNPPDMSPDDMTRKGQYRTFWYFEVAGQIQEEETRAGSIAFMGHFTPVFGVFARYRQFFESGSLPLHDSRLGVDVTLLQFSILHFSGQLGFANFSGLLARSGATSGVHMLLFPEKPLTLGFLLGTVQFPQITYLEVRPHIGFMINRLEFFVAGYMLAASSAYLRGLEAGGRIWF